MYWQLLPSGQDVEVLGCAKMPMMGRSVPLVVATAGGAAVAAARRTTPERKGSKKEATIFGF